MKKIYLLALLASVVLVSTPAFALNHGGGCGDSPENPTLILAGLAGGVFGLRSLRTRLSARKSR